MSNLRQRVFDNLNSLLAGGQFEPPGDMPDGSGAHTGGHLYGADADEIALDLVVFAADLDGETDSAVLPFVTEWLAENKLHGTT